MMSQAAVHEFANTTLQPTDDDRMEALVQKARKRLLMLQILAKRERNGPPAAKNNCCVANDEFCSECGELTPDGGGGHVFWDELELMRHGRCDAQGRHFMLSPARDEVDLQKVGETTTQLSVVEVPPAEYNDGRQHVQFTATHESVVIDDDNDSALMSMAVQLTEPLDKMDIDGGGTISRVFTTRTRAYLLEHTPADGLLYLERSIDGVDYLLVIRKLPDGRVLFRTLQK